jgi:hypothetical protein
METLFAIGMMVGLMKSHGEPPKAVAAPVEQRQIQAAHVPADRPRAHKKSEWLLGY